MAEATRSSQMRFTLRPDEREIILVRHGAAGHAAAPADPIRDHSDPDLSAAGQDQARDIAHALKDLNISALFTSGLRRTEQTAAPLLAVSGLSRIAIPDLREIHLGEWEHGEFEKRYLTDDPVCRRVFAEENWEHVPGSETRASFRERVANGLAAVIAGTPLDTSSVAVVHGGVIAEVCRSVTGSRPFAFLSVSNGSFSRLVVRAHGGIELLSFNETRHLS